MATVLITVLWVVTLSSIVMTQFVYRGRQQDGGHSDPKQRGHNQAQAMRYNKQGMLNVTHVTIIIRDLKRAVYLSQSCYNGNKTHTRRPVTIKNKLGGVNAHCV
jgi:hypothetical protein